MDPPDAADMTGPGRLEQVQRFLMPLAERAPTRAVAVLSTFAEYRVPGRSPLAGTFTGRDEIVRNFQRVFELTSASDVVKWVDWMVGTNLVAALADVHLQSGMIRHHDRLMFLFSFAPAGTIEQIRLLPEDQEHFDRYFTQLAIGG